MLDECDKTLFALVHKQYDVLVLPYRCQGTNTNIFALVPIVPTVADFNTNADKDVNVDAAAGVAVEYVG